MDKKSNFLNILKIIFSVIIKACPAYFIFYALSDMLQGLSYGFNSFLMQKFYDSINTILDNGGLATMSYLLAGAVSLVIISSQLLDGVANFMYSNMTKKLSGHMNYIVNQKLIRLKAILYEDPNKLDLINKAFESSTKCVGLVFTFISMLAFHIPYLIFMLFYLASIQPWLCVILLLMFVPMSVSQLIKSTFFAKQEDHSAPLRRSLEEYENNICSKTFFKETRTLGIYGFFRTRYINILDDLNKLNWKTERKSCIIELCTRLVAMIGYMVLLVVLIVFSVQGIISIGQFAAVFSSIGLAFSVMQGVVDRNLGLVSRNIGFTKNYVNFMDLPELSPEFNFCESDNDDIILKDVSFQYPNANSFALKDITLTIKKNETVAVVGENGSGKTTLAKVLTGIYEPSTGSVSVMGCDISEKLPYSRISAVNQKFNRYALTLKENITISDQKGDESAIPEIIEKINLELDPQIFPDALETPLTTEFGGVDLSGGQWQKVAICRGIYRNHDVIVLDEPTAAIDPIEESSVYRSFTEMSKDKTAIIITHRIGSAKIADRILVMDQGRIMETGTHDELIKKGGKYAEMYNLQADWYLIEGSNT